MGNFAERLKELRENAGLTIVELAKETGFSYMAVSRWEKKTRTPNIEVLMILATYFNVSTDYLLGFGK